MSAVPNKVLVVDDDNFSQKLIIRALHENYELKTALDGDQGIKMAIEWQPHVILLDVEMPGKKGYEVCEILKSNPATQLIPVLFLSAKDSQREKLLGFELGADDYIVKPFEARILNAKVGLAISQYVEKQKLNKQAHQAKETAFEALTSSAELGRALRFVEHTYSIPSFDALAAALFQSLKEFGLKTSVMFASQSGLLFYSHNSDVISPLEKELLTINHGTANRFTDFGNRTFCNFRQVCVLIKNMPLDNPERYGRIKDTIPFIIGAVDGKVRSLDIHDSLMRQADSLGQSVDAISSTLNALTQEFSLGHSAITGIMKELLADIELRMPKMGLEEDQEKFFVERIDRAFTDALREMDRSVMLGHSLTGVIRLLSHLQDQQQKMVRSTEVDTTVSISGLPNDGESLSGDFELF